MVSESLASAAVRFLAHSHVVSSPAVFVETLTKAIGWDGGELWLLHDDGRLRIAGDWYAEDVDATALREAARSLACGPGEGLPGRAAATGSVTWVDTIDLATTKRGSAFAEARISSAIAVPILPHGSISGVLVFLSRDGRRLPQPVLDQLCDIAAVAALVRDSCLAKTAMQEANAEIESLGEQTKLATRRAAMLEGLAAALEATGPATFEVLAMQLARALGTEFAIIAAIHANGRVQLLGGWRDGAPAQRMFLNLMPPVAEMIATGRGVACTAGASTRCSEMAMLEMGVDGYAAHPLCDSSGNVIGFAAALSRESMIVTPDGEAALRMIAARAAAELERLRMRERAEAADERLRSVAEALDDAAITIDHDGVIESVNAAATRIFGYTREELIGANVSMLMPAPHAAQHGDYIRRYLATGTSHVLGIGRNVTGRRRDGTAVPLRLTLHEVRIASKRLFTGILRDLTDLVETRQALLRSRAIIADTQRLTHIGNWVWDTETNALEWTEEIFRIFGRSRSDFEPTYPHFLMCVHPDDRAQIEAAVEAALQGGETGNVYTVEHRVVRPDGSEVTVHERGEVQYEEGRPVRMIGTVQDVTELRHSSERLFRLSSAIEQTADQVMITDGEGRIEYVNLAFEQTTGYSRESVIGQTPRILKSGGHSLAFYKNVWTTLLAGNVHRGVFINRRRDGSIVYEEKTIAPIRRADGTITHFVSTGRDIGERMRVEKEQEEMRRALALSATEWRLTFDAIEFPVFVCGPDGAIRRANRAAQELSGIPFADLIGKRLDELPHCQPWTGAAEMLSRAAAGEHPLAQVVEPVSRRTWELAAVPFGCDSATPLIIFIARDLTDLLDLQESLRRTEVMSTLGALVAGVAHEVRNPLFAISATIDAFEGRALDQQLFDQFTTRLRTELTRLTELMSDLLEYGRPTDPELHAGTLRPAVESALRSTTALASSLGVTVDASMEDSDSTVMLDERRLAIAFRNLLDNAVRHSPRGGRVTLCVDRGDDWVDVTVDDHGHGFDEDDIPRLFEPFFTRRRGGTGLGLSIVHRTIEQHGGSLTAENRPEGGARIRVRLPLAEEGR